MIFKFTQVTYASKTISDICAKAYETCMEIC